MPLTTSKGPIVGVRYDPNPATGVSYDAFLGIPYGQIPARFQVILLLFIVSVLQTTVLYEKELPLVFMNPA